MIPGTHTQSGSTTRFRECPEENSDNVPGTPRGHALPAEVYDRVRELRAQGVLQSEIARQLGISKQAVSKIVNRATDPSMCRVCGEDPAITNGICGFCREELNAA
jgi:DNA-binding XRE family transcriptional regulator